MAETETGTDTETDAEVLVRELDWKSQEILRALLENGGSANTTELRALTGIDDNNPINYRYNQKLVPRGLVELAQPEAEGNKLPPQVATLTPRGEAVAESVIEQRGESTNIGDAVEEFNARVTRVESQIDRLDTELDEAESDDGDDLKDQIDDLDRRLEALFRSMKRFRDYMNERDDGGYSEYVEQQDQDSDE
jgi:archaellum component FlaC